MKRLISTIILLLSASSVTAGPWFSHGMGVDGGDKIVNPIPKEERVYVFLRPTSSETKRDEGVPVRIIQSAENQTIADIVKAMKGAYPADYPKRPFLIVYRAETGFEAAFQAALVEASKAKFKIRARDVVWIGFSR